MDTIKFSGKIEVYKLKCDKTLELIYKHSNTINSVFPFYVQNSLLTRSYDLCVEAIAWGSMGMKGGTLQGTFIDSDFAGTTSTGTKGGLIQSVYSSAPYINKYSGTFSFASTKKINYFMIGKGYIPAGAGVTNLFTNLFCYENSLITGNNSVQYDIGEALIYNWYLQIGS